MCARRFLPETTLSKGRGTVEGTVAHRMAVPIAAPNAGERGNGSGGGGSTIEVFWRPAMALMLMSHSSRLSRSVNLMMGTFALAMMRGFSSEISRISSRVLMRSRASWILQLVTPSTQRSTSLAGSSSPVCMDPKTCTWGRGQGTGASDTAHWRGLRHGGLGAGAGAGGRPALEGGVVGGGGGGAGTQKFVYQQ